MLRLSRTDTRTVADLLPACPTIKQLRKTELRLVHDHIQKFLSDLVRLDRVADQVVQDRVEDPLPSRGFGAFHEDLLVSEHVVEDLPRDGPRVLHDLQVQYIRYGRKRNEDGLKHVGIGLLHDGRRRLLQKLTQRPQRRILEGEDVVVVVLVGVQLDLVRVAQHHHRRDEQPDQELYGLVVGLRPAGLLHHR